MNNDGLTNAYNLVVENAAKGTVDATNMPKPGQDFIAGGEKQAKGTGGDSPSAKTVSNPKEMDKKLNPGHGKIKVESTKEINKMLPESKFDQLFKKTLVEETDEGNPLGKTGEGEFDDEKGDFPPEGDGGEPMGDEELDGETGEEVDVATELRLIIDRLSEIAEKLGAYEGEGEGEEMGEAGEEMGEEGEEGEVKPVPEAVQYGKGGGGKAGGPGKGSDGKLSAFPDKKAQMMSKGNMKVKTSAVQSKQTAKGKANPGCCGKGADGKLSAFPDKKAQMMSKGNMVVKSETGKAGRSVFD